MSGNIRFIWDNLGDDATLTATSTAGSLVPANMQSDVNGRAAVWRSTSLAAQTLDFQWATAQSIDSVCLAWTNLTAAATVQIKGYTNVGDGSTVFDQTVSPDAALAIGNVTVQNWLAAASSIKQLKVVITDAANPDVYVQVSRAVAGKRISPATNAAQSGFSIGCVEQTKPARAESRDLRTERRGRHRRLQLNLGQLEVASRDLIAALVANGLGQGIWVSAFPEASDASTRQLHAFWGALVADTTFGYPAMDYWSAPLVIEEMG